MSFPITDCLRCGVCCHSKLETYVRVSGADWDRLGVDAERVAHFVGNRAYMKMSDGHCAALAIRPNATDGVREFFCTVYENRPQICRDLARGSAECKGELLGKAERVEGTIATTDVVAGSITQSAESPSVGAVEMH